MIIIMLTQIATDWNHDLRNVYKYPVFEHFDHRIVELYSDY